MTSPTATPTVMKRVRKERGYTLHALAAEIGVSVQTICSYENGTIREGRPSVRRKIERALGVPADDLLRADSENRKDPAEAGSQKVATTRLTNPYAAEEGAIRGG